MKYHDKFLPYKIYNINKPSLSESSSFTKQSKNSNSKHDRSKERD